jgi:hypothetical protein
MVNGEWAPDGAGRNSLTGDVRDRGRRRQSDYLTPVKRFGDEMVAVEAAAEG